MKVLLLTIFSLTSFAQFKAPVIPPYNQNECIKRLCHELKPFGCSSQYEQRTIEDACTRQLDLGCLTNSFTKLSRFEYDSVQEISKLATSCQYTQSLAISFASTFLSKFEIDDLNELTRLNSASWLAEVACVKDAFSNLSRYDKDDLEEVVSLTTYCAGNYDRECFKRECSLRDNKDCDRDYKVKNVLRKCVTGPTPQDRRRL